MHFKHGWMHDSLESVHDILIECITLSLNDCLMNTMYISIIKIMRTNTIGISQITSQVNLFYLNSFIPMNDIISTHYIWNNKRITIVFDTEAQSPRGDRSFTEKMCCMPHKNYVFPNELNVNRDIEQEEFDTYMKELWKTYHIFMLDCYIHSNVVRSIHNTWMVCQFDTTPNCWFFCVDLSISPEDARNIVVSSLEEYNAWANGEVYRFYEEEAVTWTNNKWETKIIWEHNDECDACWWFYSIDAILQDVGIKEVNQDNPFTN
jgi:hypothetical protein